jgi:serine/threonine protein phosphatase PrpC
LTNDAKPEDATEAKRITRKGGEVSQMCNHIGDAIGPFRVYKKGAEYPGLAMSRSLGDITAHQVGVIAKPERVSYTLKPEDQFVVFASDGIWQVMGDQEVRSREGGYMHVVCLSKSKC